MSCENSPSEISNVLDLKIVWRKQLGHEIGDQISFDPVLFENYLLFGYQTASDQGYYKLNN